jgi:hypothetical protein
VYCSKCGAPLASQDLFCATCGTHTAPAQAAAAGGPPAAAPPVGTYAYLPLYWHSVFQKFDQRPSQMQTHWNWPAFFFGAFWYLVKGMPAKGALYFVVSIASAGVGWLFLAVYAGLYGAWDYYLKEVQGKQMW